MLDEIRKHYGMRRNAKFAEFLGITPQSLYAWTQRNHFDPYVIYARCPDINPDWILSLGENGSMLKGDNGDEPQQGTNCKELGNALKALAAAQEQCRQQQEQISTLLAVLHKTIGK